MKRFPWFSALASLLALLTITPAFASTTEGLAFKLRRVPGAVPGLYVVVLRNDLPKAATAKTLDEVEALAVEHGGMVRFRYERVFRGISMMADEEALQRLARHPAVDYIEEVVPMYPDSQQLNPANWGLDRIDQRNLPYDYSYSYNSTGAGVHVYILDSGINFYHQDFSNRTPQGVDIIDLTSSPGPDGATWSEDCLTTVSQGFVGHGTHVASIAAGQIYGVAKSAILHSVKIWDCDGQSTTSDIAAAGMEWVLYHHVKPAVVNYSYNSSGSYPSTFATTVRSLIQAGITFVWSAGNTEAPSGVPVNEAIVVGASTSSDHRLPGTCWGSQVDVYAPGAENTTASHMSSSGTWSFSFTSAAAPHVTGAVARYLQSNPTATTTQVENYIVQQATPSKVLSVPVGYPNRLLYITP
jgi:subtilisin family serine protease